MKKTLLILVALITATIAFAYDAEIDGIYYNLNNSNQTAEVTYQYQYWDGGNYYGVTSITIPEKVTYNSTEYSVTSIGDYAFTFCYSLTSITIPNSVTSIGNYAFSGTPWLSNQPDGCIYINSLLCGYKGEMPENTHIDVKEGTTMICDYAFSNCSSLTSITIPNSVTSIGSYAFYECSSLTSITIGNSVTSIGDYAFSGCISLTSITIPKSVNSIGKGVFKGCKSLISINLDENNQNYIVKNNSLYSVKDSSIVFYNPLATSIIINEEFNFLEGAFACNKLDTIIWDLETIPYRTEDHSYFDGFIRVKVCPFFYSLAKDVTCFIFSEKVRSIDYIDCSKFSNLKSLIICNKSTEIGYWEEIDFSASNCITYHSVVENCALEYISVPTSLFDNCQSFAENLKEIHITDGFLSEEGIKYISLFNKSLHTIDLAGATNTTINDYTFYDCYKLENLTLPKNIETIGYKSFADCKHLTELTIPATVKEIGESAFENCRSISKITFEEGSALETIGSWAFYNNHALESVELPEGVKEIGDAAFYGCTYLEDITLPASVQRIGDNGFALCNQVKRMEVRAVTPPVIEAKTFHQVSRDIDFVVPAEARNAYAQDEYWREFIQEAPTNVENTIEGIEIYTQNGTLHLEGLTADYQIYNMSGQMVYSGNATTIDLAKGIYIIRINDKSQKIVL